MEYIVESSRKLCVSGRYDVVVVGGGMAGVAAALAAVRKGVSVCLIEKMCGLGGLATLGCVTVWLPLCDGMGHQVIGGLGEELLRLSVDDLARDIPSAGFKKIPVCWDDPAGNLQERSKYRYKASFNPTSYMLKLEELVLRNGIEIMYDTRVCGVQKEGEKITHVIIENKSGRCALKCKVVIDATGDADVCFFAGEETVSLDSNVPAGWFYTMADGELRLHAYSKRYCPEGTQEAGEGPFFRGDDAQQLTLHILETRRGIREEIEKLKAKDPEKDIHILLLPTIACFRMTRRLKGAFTLSAEHVHMWFEDTVGMTGDWRKKGPVYSIPFRCLHGKTENLLVAGRCISVDNTMWDITRVIPCCVVTGEAAGTAAALAVRESSDNIHFLEYKILHDTLIRQGVILEPTLVKVKGKK